MRVPRISLTLIRATNSSGLSILGHRFRGDQRTLEGLNQPRAPWTLQEQRATWRAPAVHGVMFDSFRKLLSEVSQGDKHPAHFAHDDYRLAAAALLVHAAAIDGNVSDAEREKLHVLIKQQFGLDEATTDELVVEATEAHVTAVVDRSMAPSERRVLIEEFSRALGGERPRELPCPQCRRSSRASINWPMPPSIPFSSRRSSTTTRTR